MLFVLAVSRDVSQTIVDVALYEITYYLKKSADHNDDNN